MLNAQHDKDADAEAAALIDSADYVQSFQDQRQPQMDDNNLTNELQRLREEIENEAAIVDIHGAPVGWKPPIAGTEWKPPKVKEENGEPTDFKDIDNPGQWPIFTFRPQFKQSKKKKKMLEPTKGKGKPVHATEKNKGTAAKATTTKASKIEEEPVGQYMYHSLPTGATPLPFKNGARKVVEYQFHYAGWWNDDTQYRDGATTDNLFPDERSGSLDGDVLERLGMTLERMCEHDGAPDALFFYQLLLPILHIDNNKGLTAPHDPWKGFYSDVARWANLCAAGDLGILGGGYGHEFQSVLSQEVMQWDGSVVMDGILGGLHGSFLSRFDNRDGNQSFHKGIASTFTKS